MALSYCHVSDDLEELGWDARWAAAFAPHAAEGLTPARVAIEFNHIFRGFTAAGELQAQHAGRFQHRAIGPQRTGGGRRLGGGAACRPARRPAPSRRCCRAAAEFSRKVAGELTEEQVVAANIDTVFLVMGLDGDYNPRRLERYLLLAYESGASPGRHSEQGRSGARAAGARWPRSPRWRRASRSTRSASSAGLGLRRGRVSQHLGPGRTGALLGSSGVGKSTLINALIGDARLKTQEVRASDSRGRHTTRHRQLIVLPGQGLLIDTPGMRELQLWDASSTTRDSFDDIEALADGCHFSDCRHRDEPRCAVKQAVVDGQLPEIRLTSYLKLQDELDTLGARKDARALIDEKRRSKVTGKALKAFYKQRAE